jgi:hypothetical protein
VSCAGTREGAEILGEAGRGKGRGSVSRCVTASWLLYSAVLADPSL